MGTQYNGLFACACILAALIAVAGCVSAPKPQTPAKPRQFIENYPCYQIDAALKMDGRMSDPAWAKAPALNFYVPPNSTAPEFPTEARILYDKNYIYVGFKAQDTDIWGYFTNRDDNTCLDDCLEFFFLPDPAREPYYNFEVNALGTTYDALNLRAMMFGGGGRRWNKWDCDGFKVKTACNGTLNDPADKDQSWTMEMAVPFAELPTLAGKTPQPGDIWMFHVARCEYSVCNTNRGEYSSCAPLAIANFHVTNDWLKLNFK